MITTKFPVPLYGPISSCILIKNISSLYFYPALLLSALICIPVVHSLLFFIPLTFIQVVHARLQTPPATLSILIHGHPFKKEFNYSEQVFHSFPKDIVTSFISFLFKHDTTQTWYYISPSNIKYYVFYCHFNNFLTWH